MTWDNTRQMLSRMPEPLHFLGGSWGGSTPSSREATSGHWDSSKSQAAEQDQSLFKQRQGQKINLSPRIPSLRGPSAAAAADPGLAFTCPQCEKAVVTNGSFPSHPHRVSSHAEEGTLNPEQPSLVEQSRLPGNTDYVGTRAWWIFLYWLDDLVYRIVDSGSFSCQ